MAEVRKLVKELGVDEEGEQALKEWLVRAFSSIRPTEPFTAAESAGIMKYLGISYGRYRVVMRSDRLKHLFATVDNMFKVDVKDALMPEEMR